MNKDRPVMSAAKLQPTKYTFQRCIDYVDSARRSSAGGLKQGCGGKTSYFVAKCVNISKTAGDAAIVTMKLHYALSIDTKVDDLG